MEEEYDTDAFVVFMIAMISIYILIAALFIYKRIRRFLSKEPVKKEKKGELVEVEEPVVENPLTTAFWVNVVLVIIGVIVVSRLTGMTESEEPELFDPYTTLGISVGASERAIKSAYRKMAKLYHPDKPTGSVEKFRDIEKAYRILTDEIARANYERYGNPDGPSATKVGIALPSWMMEKTGSKLVIVGYLLLMILVIPLIVYCLKNKTGKKEKAKVKEETVALYYQRMNESTPIQSVPELFVSAEEILSIMQATPYDSDILVFLNNLCPKKDFSSSKMRKPHVTAEKAKEDPKLAALLKGNVLLHCYLNHVDVGPLHTQEIHALLRKSPDLLEALLAITRYSRIKGKPPAFSLACTVIHFQQYVYQGLWVTDSPLKQLPHFTDREATMNKPRYHDNELREFLRTSPGKWKGLKQFLPSQMTDLENAVKHFPRLSVEAHFEVEDEEDIFVGDMVSCKVKIVRENMLPAGATVEDVMNGKLPEEEESEEEELEKKSEKSVKPEGKPEEKPEEKEMMTAEEFTSMLDETPVEPLIEFEAGVVYSKNYPFKIHEHWIIVITDPADKYMLDLMVIPYTGLFIDTTLFRVPATREGSSSFHLHFFCPCYIGLDFSVPVTMKVKPESQKPKVVINEKDLALDKKRGLVDMLNAEMDDGWESSEEEEEIPEEKPLTEETSLTEKEEKPSKKEPEKPLTKKERQRLYHLEKKKAREEA